MASSPVLLAIDTSTRSVGLALYDGIQVLGEMVWSSQDHHTVELAPAVSELLNRAGIAVSGLGALAVALGPGSFTGLRIGLALAKGIALARRLPMVGIPTLDGLAAAQAVRAPKLAAVLKAGRGRLAVSWYQASEAGEEGPAWQSLKKIEVLTAAELNAAIHNPTVVCGELSEEERRLLARKRRNVLLASPAGGLRRPAFLAELGWRRWQAGNVDDPATLAPVYLHYNDPIPE
jgi:tRNA threonylcarbamoyladenosine biosynthesis protein TsaB